MFRVSVSYQAQAAQLKEIRQVRPDVAQWSFSSQQATLRRLNRAFAAFFQRVVSGKTPGYPRFKAANRLNAVEWPKDGDGCRWRPDVSRVYLQGIGEVKTTLHRHVKGTPKTIQARREGRRWHLVLSCDGVPAKHSHPPGTRWVSTSGSRAFSPPPMATTRTTLAGPGALRDAWSPPSKPWPERNRDRTTVGQPVKPFKPATARSPIAVGASTTRALGNWLLATT